MKHPKTNRNTTKFPKDFVWGAATASYQIEGSPANAGGGLSVWDTFCMKPGNVKDGQSGEVACDHYNRYREDVALMKKLGLKGYRFSISWPRVLPDGVGTVNAVGLDFYDRLVDELLAAGITPFVTLFHWDFPDKLYKRKGWLNSNSPDWFADYTQIVAARLSDRVRHWMTLNEPQVFVVIGHQWGVHAPGVRLDLKDVLRIGHNVLLAHGKAVQTLRAESKTPCQIGIAPAAVNKMPATNTPADIEAARLAEFAITDLHLFNNTWWLDPIFFGHYPEDGLKLYGDNVPKVRAADMQTISQPLDFVGLNIYVGDTVRAGADEQIETLPRPIGCPRTTFDSLLFITPPAIYWTPRFFYERYGKPLYITENGMANTDWVALDGKVHDPQRIDYMHRHLLELRRAIADGVDVRGYFHWSFMDNFEWAEGYRQRFGITFVDYVTQKRIPKDSFGWYREVIRSNGGSLK